MGARLPSGGFAGSGSSVNLVSGTHSSHAGKAFASRQKIALQSGKNETVTEINAETQGRSSGSKEKHQLQPHGGPPTPPQGGPAPPGRAERPAVFTALLSGRQSFSRRPVTSSRPDGGGGRGASFTSSRPRRAVLRGRGPRTVVGAELRLQPRSPRPGPCLLPALL